MEVTSNSFITREGDLYRVPISDKLCTILGTRYAEIPLQIYKTESGLALSYYHYLMKRYVMSTYTGTI